MKTTVKIINKENGLEYVFEYSGDISKLNVCVSKISSKLRWSFTSFEIVK